MDKSTEKFLKQSILFKCPHCDATISFKIKQAGSDVECYSCQNKVRINKQIIFDEYFEEEFPDVIDGLREILSE